MGDVVELILGALAIVLCGAAFAVSWQVIREAWRGASRATQAAPAPADATRSRARRAAADEAP